MSDLELESITDSTITYTVRSKSAPATRRIVQYERDSKKWSCSCPGYNFRGRCRHIPGGGLEDGPESRSVRSYDSSADRSSQSAARAHLPPNIPPEAEKVALDFSRVKPALENLTRTDPIFRDAVRTRHGWRMAFRILELGYGIKVRPPTGMTLDELAASLPSLATIIRWTLPIAKILQSEEELAKGQELREAHSWVATNIENGQARPDP